MAARRRCLSTYIHFTEEERPVKKDRWRKNTLEGEALQRTIGDRATQRGRRVGDRVIKVHCETVGYMV